MSDRPRSRGSKAQQNDELIRVAALNALVLHGTDLLSMSDVARAAGLTHGAMYARYENVEELYVDLWLHKCSHALVNFIESLKRLIAEPSEQTLEEWRAIVFNPSLELACGFYLMASSRRIETLDEEIRPFLSELLPLEPDSVTTNNDARLVFLFFYSKWMILSRKVQVDDSYWSIIRWWLLSILLDESPYVRSVDDLAVARPITRGSLDVFRTNLFAGTATVVGRVGYTKATISRIARRTPCTPSAIYKLFASKQELVVHVHRESLRTAGNHYSGAAGVLDPDILVRWAYELGADENALRRNFTFEYALACFPGDNMSASLQYALQGIARWLSRRLPNPQLPESRAAASMLVDFNSAITAQGTYLGSRPSSEYGAVLLPWRLAVLNSLGIPG